MFSEVAQLVLSCFLVSHTEDIVNLFADFSELGVTDHQSYTAGTGCTSCNFLVLFVWFLMYYLIYHRCLSSLALF